MDEVLPSLRERCPKLHSLSLEWCQLEQKYALLRARLAITNCVWFRHLEILFGNEAHWPDLRLLSLSFNKLTSSALSLLAAVPNLEQLNLAQNPRIDNSGT